MVKKTTKKDLAQHLGGNSKKCLIKSWGLGGGTKTSWFGRAPGIQQKLDTKILFRFVLSALGEDRQARTAHRDSPSNMDINTHVSFFIRMKVSASCGCCCKAAKVLSTCE